jgi:tetratricopeptide (TPR) repeat protein
MKSKKKSQTKLIASPGGKKNITLSYKEAFQLYKKEPNNPDLARALGVDAFQRNEFESAVTFFERVIELGRTDRESQKHLAIALVNTGRAPEAYERLLQLYQEDEHSNDVLNALVNVCGLLKKTEEAYKFSMEYIQKYPTHYLAYISLGNVLFENRRFKEALIAYETARDLGANNSAVDQNIASSLHYLGRSDEALERYEAATKKFPDSPALKFLMAYPLLERDEFGKGWDAYEYGFLANGQGRTPVRKFAAPRWEGAALAPTDSLLVWGEQGLGDQIMFTSCLPDLVEDTKARVILEISPRLVTLYQRSFPSIQVRSPTGEIRNGVPYNNDPVTAEIPIGSLPRLYRRSYEAFGKTKRKYLTAHPELVRLYGQRFVQSPEFLRVGLCWRSGLVTSLRSIHYVTLQQMLPILKVPNVVLVNLQYGDCSEEVNLVQNKYDVMINNWPDVDLKNDQESVAAIITNLDLVISAGTAVAQLAGAVGTPAWVFAGKSWTQFGRGSGFDPWHPASQRFQLDDDTTSEILFGAMAAKLSSVQKNRALVGAV